MTLWDEPTAALLALVIGLAVVLAGLPRVALQVWETEPQADRNPAELDPSFRRLRMNYRHCGLADQLLMCCYSNRRRHPLVRPTGFVRPEWQLDDVLSPHRGRAPVQPVCQVPRRQPLSMRFDLRWGRH